MKDWHDMTDRPEVREIVEEWIDYEILGEPDGVTALRHAYVQHHLARCLHALSLVPKHPSRGRLLELGSGLYLMTFLLERLGNYDLDLVQYWDKRAGDYSTILVNRKTGDERAYAFKHFNAETDPFPYPDEAFDVIVNCDTIEHLLCNPVHMLVESHRILKPGGVMVVSTPNVLRLSNLCRLLRGQNIYDKYCQESAYARHPREYTPEEIRLLFKAVGFEVAHLETRDLTPQTEGRRARLFAALLVRFLERVASLRKGWAAVPLSWRGEQIFLVARRAGAARRAAPEFLFEAPTLARQTIEAICRPTETVRS